MDREGRVWFKEEIPGTRWSMHDYILTYSKLYRKNLWVLGSQNMGLYFLCVPQNVESGRPLWGGSEGIINFTWICYAMLSVVLVGHFQNISGHLFTRLVCRSFQWSHWLISFTDCNVWDDEDKVIGFKKSHWIHLGWWSTGSPKLQLFQLSQHPQVTNCRFISSSAYFPWNMTLKYTMQLFEGSWDKILHSKSRTLFFEEEFFSFFLTIWLSKRYTKVPEVVFATSL